MLERVIHTQPGQVWPSHWHEEWSIGVVVAGRCSFGIGGATKVAEAGDVLAIAPLAPHTCGLECQDAAGAHAVMVYVPLAWFELSDCRPPDRSAIVRSADLAARATRIEDIAAARQWVGDALGALRIGGAGLTAPSATLDEVSSRILGHLERTVATGSFADVATLARDCGVSREHFQRVAARHLGMTPAAYLRTARMMSARQQLLAGTSIVDAAAACGFADQAHFTRWFRRSFGYTPGALLRAGDGDKTPERPHGAPQAHRENSRRPAESC
jgi:AraC-like DNA-binding protein